MKLWIPTLALVLMAAVVKSDHKEDIQRIDMACRAESHVTEDELKSFLNDDKKAMPSNALKCHMKCMMDRQGHWKNGGFDSAAALQHLQEMPNLKEHQQEIVQVIQDCKDKKGKDECDTAYLVAKCIVDHHPPSI